MLKQLYFQVFYLQLFCFFTIDQQRQINSTRNQTNAPQCILVNHNLFQCIRSTKLWRQMYSLLPIAFFMESSNYWTLNGENGHEEVACEFWHHNWVLGWGWGFKFDQNLRKCSLRFGQPSTYIISKILYSCWWHYERSFACGQQWWFHSKR